MNIPSDQQGAEKLVLKIFFIIYQMKKSNYAGMLRNSYFGFQIELIPGK
ncbi:MAG: hypothetical protein NTX88_07535 [Candidatus Atribacteria bacterium]|nr:hypothetical protein [Candidatus Atribacteria bacterium]